MEEERRPLTDAELKEVLKRVQNKLEAARMQADNITGRTLTVDNSEGTKRSGGIMISKREDTESDYLGTYYSFEEFMVALNEFLDRKTSTMSGTFKRRGKLKVDQEAVDTALEEFTSLFVEKIIRERGNGDFYAVSRSDRGSTDEKRTGGLVTPKGMVVEEGRYVDEATARAIADGVVDEVEPVIVPPIPDPLGPPPEIEVEAGSDESPVDPVIDDDKEDKDKPTLVQEPRESTFKRRKVKEEEKNKFKELAAKVRKVLLIPLIAFTISAGIPTDGRSDTITDMPTPPPIEQEDNDIDLAVDDIFIPPVPEIDTEEVTAEDSVSTEETTSSDLEIGDIVEMKDGMTYDHTSQAQDGISGEIGANPYREAGDYTVDVIAILDGETGEIIATTHEAGSNLDDLLLAHGLSREDVESGKVQVRYNVSEGINADLDRAEAAGWVTYDAGTYQDKGNAVEDMLSAEDTAQMDEQTNDQGGYNL